jgi:hypothetical protein
MEGPPARMDAPWRGLMMTSEPGKEMAMTRVQPRGRSREDGFSDGEVRGLLAAITKPECS